jgi:hypothetical protein
MKTIRFFLKFQLLFIFIFLVFTSSYGQESYIKNRFNIKVAYSRYNTGAYTIIDNKEKYYQTGNYRIEGNYGLYNSFETGFYLGFSVYPFYVDQFTPSVWAPSYGININYHILPLVIKKEDFRFDFYTLAKFGAIYFATPDNYGVHGNFGELFLGGGFTFYLWDHVGFFAEYGYNRILNKNADQFNIGANDKLRYGISIKFKQQKKD